MGQLRSENRGSVAVATVTEDETSVAAGRADEGSLPHGAPVASRALPPEDVAFSERVDRILTERREAGTPVSLEEAEDLALQEELGSHDGTEVQDADETPDAEDSVCRP